MTQSIDVFTDARHFERGGKWSCHEDDVVANFPACKFLLHEDDLTNGDLTWTDRVGGTIAADSAGFIKDSLGVIQSGPDTGSITGTMPTTAGKDTVLFAGGTYSVGNTPGSAHHLGDTQGNGPGIGFAGAGGQEYVVRAAGNYHTLDSLAGSYPLSGIGVHADIGGNATTSYGCEPNGTVYSAAGAATLTITGTWGTLTNHFDIPNTTSCGTTLFTLFAFTIDPTDADAAMYWMSLNPGKLYPGWAGKS